MKQSVLVDGNMVAEKFREVKASLDQTAEHWRVKEEKHLCLNPEKMDPDIKRRVWFMKAAHWKHWICLHAAYWFRETHSYLFWKQICGYVVQESQR